MEFSPRKKPVIQSPPFKKEMLIQPTKKILPRNWVNWLWGGWLENGCWGILGISPQFWIVSCSSPAAPPKNPCHHQLVFISPSRFREESFGKGPFLHAVSAELLGCRCSSYGCGGTRPTIPSWLCLGCWSSLHGAVGVGCNVLHQLGDVMIL